MSATTNLDDMRRMAGRRLPRMIMDFLEGGAEDEVTVRRNRQAMGRYGLVPRVLEDVSAVDTSTDLLGRRMAMPLILSPTGATRLFHPEGELAVARAAKSAGVFYALSTMSTCSLEEVAEVAGPRIFQLYILRDRALTQDLVRRAVDSGYDALCLTVDMPVGGQRERDLRNRISLPFRPGLAGLVGIAAKPRWAANMVFRTRFRMANFDSRGMAGGRHGNMGFVNSQFDRSVTWKDVEWLAGQSGLPLMIKGILSPRDAIRARDAGAQAIMVSNHGGRQMDHAPAPMEVIAPIRDAVGDGMDLVLDGGVRRGTDIIKAIARGASACSLGRPYLHGLAMGGERGVDRMFAILRSELERNMALMGVSRIDQIDGSFLHQVPAE